MSAVCSSPLRGYRVGGEVFLARPKGHSGAWFPIACGKCFSCSIARPSSMAVRMFLESLCHEETIFVTPTYAPEHLPPDGELVERDMALFRKNIRQKIRRDPSLNVCGGWRVKCVYAMERGERRGRPHGHAIFFGVWPRDAKAYGKDRMFTSEFLNECWGHRGQALFGSADSGSFEYVARYTLKANGQSTELPVVVDPSTGELRELRAPFARYSPGIGLSWFQRFGGGIGLGRDYVVVNGQKRSVPRYLMDKLKAENPELVEAMVDARVKAASAPYARWNSRADRLKVREVCLKAKIGIGGAGKVSL